MNRVKIVLILLTVFLISLNAQPRPAFPNHEKENADLNLTENQKETMKNLRFEHAESMITLESDLKKVNLEIKKILSSHNFSVSDVKSLMSEKQEIKNAIEDARFDHWASVYDILDESQKDKWGKRLLKFGEKIKRTKEKPHHERMRRAD